MQTIYDETKDAYRDVRTGLSRLEGVGPCLYINDDYPNVCEDAKVTFNEVCHIHQVGCTAKLSMDLKIADYRFQSQQDLSFHVVLSHKDAAIAIQNQWCEAFALTGRVMRVGRLKGRRVPLGYMILYTPRTMAELEIAKDIIKAAVLYALSGSA